MKSHPIISHFKIQSFALVRFCFNLQKLIKFKHTELSAIINHDIIQQKCCECDYDEKKSHTNVLQISFVSFDQKLFFRFPCISSLRYIHCFRACMPFYVYITCMMIVGRIVTIYSGELYLRQQQRLLLLLQQPSFGVSCPDRRECYGYHILFQVLFAISQNLS